MILAYPNIKSATGSLRNLIYEGEFAANSHDADSDVYRAFFDELVKIKTEVPKDYLIYIPQSETGYWFKKDYALAPMSLGILVLSEHPAIFGIPRNSEIKESGSFRFWTGAIPEYWTYPENPTFEQICIEAKKSSFHHYLELNWSSTEHRVTRQEHECP